MAFNLGDIVIDRVQIGLAESFDDVVLYGLSNLQDLVIEVTSESKEARDKDGNLVVKVFTGKNGTLNATNAMINAKIMEAASGSPAKYASVDVPVAMPKIVYVKPGATADLTGFVEGTVKVNAYYANKNIGEAYALGTTASATEYAIAEDGTFTPPTATDVPCYIVKYERSVTSGVQITNRTDKFPRAIRLTFKALAIDPCSPGTLRACYIVIPSFQVSPDLTITMSTDATMDYNGDLQVDYCSIDNVLYHFFWADDDVED